MAEGLTPIQEAAEQMGAGGVLVRRWLGCWIDLLALAGIVLGSYWVTHETELGEPIGEYAVFVATGAGLLYFPLLEGVWGRSLGKLVTGLKIVDKNGAAPGLGRALLRTLLRLVEVNPALLGGIPAGICVMVTKRKQRLGDLAAGTYALDAGEIRRALDVEQTLSSFR